MKKLVSIFFIAVLSTLVVSCGNAESKDKIRVIYSDEDEGLDAFDAFNLKPYEINAMVFLPNEAAGIGASTDTEVLHEMDGYEWWIKVGPNFELKIEDWGDEPFEEFVKNVKDQDIFDVEVLEQEKDYVIYKTILKSKGEIDNNVGVGHESYHVAVQHTIDGINYIFRTDEDGCDEKIAGFVFKSARSVRPVEVEMGI